MHARRPLLQTPTQCDTFYAAREGTAGQVGRETPERQMQCTQADSPAGMQPRGELALRLDWPRELMQSLAQKPVSPEEGRKNQHDLCAALSNSAVVAAAVSIVAGAVAPLECSLASDALADNSLRHAKTFVGLLSSDFSSAIAAVLSNREHQGLLPVPGSGHVCNCGRQSIQFAPELLLRILKLDYWDNRLMTGRPQPASALLHYAEAANLIARAQGLPHPGCGSRASGHPCQTGSWWRSSRGDGHRPAALRPSTRPSKNQGR